MDYQELKVAELRKLCMERGIAVPSGAKKAQLVAWLEAADRNSPIEVEAVTVDEEIIPANALAVDVEGMREAAIGLTAAIDAAATAFGEYDADQETIEGMAVADIRVCEGGIAEALKQVDERRKELTRKLTEPKKAIDAKCKEMTVPLAELAQRYADARQAVYEKGYRAQYEDCCISNGIDKLAELVPYERFIAGHGQWVSRTANPVKTQEKIADEVARIARDWDSLRQLRGSMRYYDEAEREFFATLDLNAAIAKNKAVTAQQERLDALNREREEAERWRAEQAAKRAQEPPAPAWTPEFEEVEPEPAKEPERHAEPARARKRYHFEAWLDDAELMAFKDWKNAEGIGEGWTFREVRNG